MKVLILGGSGMLGHKLWQTFRDRFDTYVTFRQQMAASLIPGIFDAAHSIDGVTAQDFDSVVRAFARVRPDVVVNCIGIVKQDAAAKDPVVSISVNALFPHRLAELCGAANARLIHLSTDCVFSGQKGDYRESDSPDAADLYGRTKLLGEIGSRGCLTLRTSMIGRELRGSQGLVEWFLSQQGKSVRGFRHAIFTGFTTPALAEVIARIIEERRELEGVWHVATEPISKLDLLMLIKKAGGLDIQVEPDETFFCDRSLNSTLFRQATSFVPPSWSDMISQLFKDTTPYKEIRRMHC